MRGREWLFLAGLVVLAVAYSVAAVAIMRAVF